MGFFGLRDLFWLAVVSVLLGWMCIQNLGGSVVEAHLANASADNAPVASSGDGHNRAPATRMSPDNEANTQLVVARQCLVPFAVANADNAKAASSGGNHSRASATARNHSEKARSRIFNRTVGDSGLIVALGLSMRGASPEDFSVGRSRDFHRCLSDVAKVRDAPALCQCSCLGTQRLETFRGRVGAYCAADQTLERHRAICTVLAHSALIPDLLRRAATAQRLSIVHVAPEYSIGSALLQVLGGGDGVSSYVGGDFTGDPGYKRVLENLARDFQARTQWKKIDLTDLERDFHEDSVDLFLCTHVLEHVPDDLQAMRQIYTVLRSGGIGIINVPLFPEALECPPSIVKTSADRLRVFGQHDHVRKYSLDLFVERLASVGFGVIVIRYDEWLKTVGQWGVIKHYANLENHRDKERVVMVMK